MTITQDEDGLMVKGRSSVSAQTSELTFPRDAHADQISQSPVKQPGVLYYENGEDVAYTAGGKRIVLRSDSVDMILCELEYLKMYPRVEEQMYGKKTASERVSAASEDSESRARLSDLEKTISAQKVEIRTLKERMSGISEEAEPKQPEKKTISALKTGIVSLLVGVVSGYIGLITLSVAYPHLASIPAQESAVPENILLLGCSLGAMMGPLAFAYLDNKYKIVC